MHSRSTRLQLYSYRSRSYSYSRWWSHSSNSRRDQRLSLLQSSSKKGVAAPDKFGHCYQGWAWEICLNCDVAHRLSLTQTDLARWGLSANMSDKVMGKRLAEELSVLFHYLSFFFWSRLQMLGQACISLVTFASEFILIVYDTFHLISLTRNYSFRQLKSL